MSDDLEFIVIDDIPEYIFCIGDDEENEQVIAIRGKDGAFKYEKVAELPTTGEDGVLYLVPKAHTTQTVTGNPITATVAEEVGVIESFQLDGDTYQYSYDGGNLFNTTLEHGIISSGTGEDGESATNRLRTVGFIELIGGATTVTVETNSSKTLQFVPRYYSEDGTYLGYGGLNWQTSPKTLNLPRGTKKMRLLFRFSDDTTMSSDQITSISITENPAPNPSYPQDINVVTGTQTISINGTNYPISLGSLELCKLGTYQDYIWKDGEDWKVHKNTNRFTFEEPKTSGLSKQTLGFVYNVDNNPLAGKYIPLVGKCSHFGVEPTGTTWTKLNKVGMNAVGALWFMTTDSSQGDTRTSAEFAQWLVDAGVSFVYALETPTDTTITDQTLIAQLEAIRTASLETGTNTISNTATGTNLAGDLEIGCYGYDPLNKYDKYFWLDVDGAYESL